MKKVAIYLSCSPSWGGTFQYALSMIQALSVLNKQGAINLIVLYEDPLWKGIISQNGITQGEHCQSSSFLRGGLFRIWKFFFLPLSLWRRITPFFHPTVRAIMKVDADVCFFPSQDQMSFFGPYPSVTAIHDLMHRYEDFPEVKSPEIYRLREYLYRNICKYSELILADSEVGKFQIGECYGLEFLEKTKVLSYIIPYYLEEKLPDQTIFDRLQIPGDYIFYPAQFWKHKNHKNLILAFSILKEKYPKIALVLSGGKNNAYDEIRELVSELGLEASIIFAGYVSEEEMIALYQNTKCLVMPTFFGPTNIPPLEALSFGVPVVYSKIYAYREFLGESAVYVDPKDVEDIARGVDLVLSGKFERSTYDFKGRRELFINRIKDICLNL
jgi:glycosyltransferase involved in cell wall biosynthesis